MASLTRTQRKALTILHDRSFGQRPVWFAQRMWGEFRSEDTTINFLTKLIEQGWVKHDEEEPDRYELTTAGVLVLLADGAKKEYWWVSVGGNPCEPAVVNHEGIFTVGCPDAHDIAGIELIEQMGGVPDTPALARRKAKAWEARRKREAALGIHHGYRTFD